MKTIYQLFKSFGINDLVKDSLKLGLHIFIDIQLL